MEIPVIVKPKKSVLDSQGVVVRNALKDLGLDSVQSVRVGKLLELNFFTSPSKEKLTWKTVPICKNRF